MWRLYCVHHGRGPAVNAGGSAAHCVRSGMAGAAGGNRGRWAAREKDSGNGMPQPAAHLPLLLPACGAPFRETRQR